MLTKVIMSKLDGLLNLKLLIVAHLFEDDEARDFWYLVFDQGITTQNHLGDSQVDAEERMGS